MKLNWWFCLVIAAVSSSAFGMSDLEIENLVDQVIYDLKKDNEENKTRSVYLIDDPEKFIDRYSELNAPKEILIKIADFYGFVKRKKFKKTIIKFYKNKDVKLIDIIAHIYSSLQNDEETDCLAKMIMETIGLDIRFIHNKKFQDLLKSLFEKRKTKLIDTTNAVFSSLEDDSQRYYFTEMFNNENYDNFIDNIGLQKPLIKIYKDEREKFIDLIKNICSSLNNEQKKYFIEDITKVINHGTAKGQLDIYHNDFHRDGLTDKSVISILKTLKKSKDFDRVNVPEIQDFANKQQHYVNITEIPVHLIIGQPKHYNAPEEQHKRAMATVTEIMKAAPSLPQALRAIAQLHCNLYAYDGYVGKRDYFDTFIIKLILLGDINWTGW